MHLPSGLGDLSTVPRLQLHDEEHDAQAMLDEYVRAIRATVRVFATYQPHGEYCGRATSTTACTQRASPPLPRA